MSEWADYAAVKAQCGNLSGNNLTCNLSGNIWPQSPQLAEPQLTDPGIKIIIVSFYSLTIKTVSIPNLLDVAGQIPVILGACSWHVLTEETGNGFCWHGLHLARRDWFLHLSAADGLCGLLLLFVLVQGKKERLTLDQ